MALVTGQPFTKPSFPSFPRAIFNEPYPQEPSSSPTSPSSSSQSRPSDPSTMGFVNAAYYPNWRSRQRDDTPACLDARITTHLYYGHAGLDQDGIILLDQELDLEAQVDGQRGCLRACLALKRINPALKVILSIGGERCNDAFQHVGANPRSRARFAQCARAIVDEYGLDGIDVDWEHPKQASAREGEILVLLLSALRDQLPERRYTLTAAFPANGWTLNATDLAKASSYLDFINVMCFDFAGPWTTLSGHHAQLYIPSKTCNIPDQLIISCHSAIQYFIDHKHVPLHKLVLGVPAFGRAFHGARNVNQEFKGSITFPYKELPRPQTFEEIDREAGSAYCVGGDGGFVTYDNQDTVGMKAQYVKHNKLGGLMLWDAPCDKTGYKSLLLNAYMVLNNS